MAFTGSPEEIATQVAEALVLPCIRSASQGMPPEQLAQFYGGLLISVLAYAAADFGQANAIDIGSQVLAMLEKTGLEPQGAH